MYKVGDIVEHSQFGRGVVENGSKDATTVLFENTNEVKRIANKFLRLIKKYDSSIIKTEKLTIYPADYNNFDDISSAGKELANYIIEQGLEGDLYLDVSMLDDDKKKYSFIVCKRGLVVFDYISIDKLFYESMKDIIIASIKNAQINMKEKIINHLSLSSDLLSDNKLIIQPQCTTFISKGMKWAIPDFEKNAIPYVTSGTKNELSLSSTILEKHKRIIANMLAPQYIVVIPRNSNHLNARLKPLINSKSHANGIELSILKQEQIVTLKEITPEIKLILANAGAGKSVLLLAKAYELCSRGYKNVLVTCYNNNLSEEYSYKSEECGLNNKKDLFIMTFHKFILKYSSNVYSKEFSIEEIDDAVNFLITKLMADKRAQRFSAIMVDEMQIFPSSWLDLCYLLLSEPKDEAFFVMVGDINQDVRGISRSASLNFYETKLIPNDRKKVNINYLHYNYRNTIEISTVLNRMLINHNQLMNRIKVLKIKDVDDYVLGESIKHGPVPKYIKTDRGNIATKIVDELVKIKKSNRLQFGDIAIIFPYQERIFLRYFLSKWLSDELSKRGFPFNFIFGDSNKTRLSQVDGVVLSTIDSSLGLDFKAVILCGLYTLTVHNYENEFCDVKSMKISGEINTSNKKAFDDYIRIEGYKLYIACSRARDYLTVINDIDDENILVDSIFGGVFK